MGSTDLRSIVPKQPVLTHLGNASLTQYVGILFLYMGHNMAPWTLYGHGLLNTGLGSGAVSSRCRVPWANMVGLGTTVCAKGPLPARCADAHTEIQPWYFEPHVHHCRWHHGEMGDGTIQPVPWGPSTTLRQVITGDDVRTVLAPRSCNLLVQRIPHPLRHSGQSRLPGSVHPCHLAPLLSFACAGGRGAAPLAGPGHYAAIGTLAAPKVEIHKPREKQDFWDPIGPGVPLCALSPNPPLQPGNWQAD